MTVTMNLNRIQLPFLLSFFCLILLHPPSPCLAHISTESTSYSETAPSQAPANNPLSDLDPDIAYAFKSSFIFNQPIRLPAQPNPALKFICDSTDYPDVCVSALGPSFSAGNVDPISVLEATMKTCAAHLKIAITMATKLAARSSVGMASGFKVCKDNYKDALDNLEIAVSAIPARDIGTIDAMLSAVVSDVATCDDELKGIKLPMANLDVFITHLASNCLALASLIHH